MLSGERMACKAGNQIDVSEYEKKYEEQQIKYVTKKAAKLGYQLVPVVPA